MSEAEGLPAAGWYPDPLVEGRERWWDGTGWSDHVQPAGTAAASAPTAPVAEPAAPASPVVPVPPEPAAPEPAPVPGLTMPEPALASVPGLTMPDLLPAEPAIQPPALVPTPQLATPRPGYTPPSPAPYPPPVPEQSSRTAVTAHEARVASFRLSSGVGGRGSALEAARAVRPSGPQERPRNPAATVSIFFGVASLLLPVVLTALVAIFAGMAGLRRASAIYPPVGRGLATAAVVLGIISLMVTAMAAMIAMADPAIRALVLGVL